MCLKQLFSLFGMPNYIHSDLDTSFLSRELKDYLTKRGIATSRTTPYHPIGNGQVERYNGIIWKAVRLALISANLPDSRWELVLADAFDSIRSLLCTSANETPHERFSTFIVVHHMVCPCHHGCNLVPYCYVDLFERVRTIHLWMKWS
jgi:transposase InsO family protein